MDRTNSERDQIIAQIHKLLAAGKSAQAEVMCQLALERYSGQAAVLHMHGLVLFRMGRQGEGIAQLRKAVQAGPDAGHLATLGETLRQTGEHEQAEAILRQALGIDPTHADARHALGCLFHERGALEEAAIQYEGVLASHPDAAQALYNLGVIRKEQGREGEALELFREAVRLEPQWTDPRKRLAELLLSAGAEREAQGHLIEVFRLSPVDFEMWRPFGRVLEGLAWFEAVVANPAIEDEQEFHRAGILHELRRYEAAVEAYRRTIHAEPGVVDRRLALVDVLISAGQMPAAIPEMREIMRLEMVGFDEVTLEATAPVS